MSRQAALFYAAFAATLVVAGFAFGFPEADTATFVRGWQRGYTPASPRVDLSAAERLVAGAAAQVGVTTVYYRSYVGLSYPGGDVPRERGVCTDVVVRAYRTLGVDLQQRVHEDMRDDFGAYPRLWRLKRPDPNIDHRRVANLMRFFERAGAALPLGDDAADYRPGDVVVWRLESGQLHTGIVADKDGAIIHNVGAGARRERVLFRWPILAHFRYYPAS